AARSVLRQVRPRNHAAKLHQPRHRQLRRGLRPAQARRVRHHPDSADGRPDRDVTPARRAPSPGPAADLKEKRMAQFTTNAQRLHPYKNFKSRVFWDGVTDPVAGVSKVSALKRTTEVVKHRDGGDASSSRKSPGRTEYEPITLERGVTHDTEFEKWANKVWNY